MAETADLFRHVTADKVAFYRAIMAVFAAAIRIGNFVMRTWRASPWRFGVDEYRTAIAQAAPRPRDIGEDRVQALWDGELASAMDEHGLIIAEEAVVTGSLDDLRQDAGA